MEGSGERMVAIIQNLQSAGLAVTLMSAPRAHISVKSRKRVPIAKYSVKTNTELPKRSVSAQICDAHYASSYQLAHCHMSPSSPSRDSPEFPLQRITPSRTRGNFRVGRSGSGESSFRGLGKRERSRDSFSRCPCPSGPSDSFVDSLRKYPLSPGRSASSELVQRLLNYTQAKHFSRNNSGSIRSLTPSPQSVLDTITKQNGNKASRPSNKTSRASNKTSRASNKASRASNKASRASNKSSRAMSRANKNIQTYTRTVNEMSAIKHMPVTHKKNCRNPSDDTKFKSNFPANELSESYNYLKTSMSGKQSYTGQGPEVRYLKDVKRFIRDTIRQIVNSTAPVPCSKAQSRYIEHRKTHHRKDSSTIPIQLEEEYSKEDEHNINFDSTANDTPRDQSLISKPSPGVCREVLNRYRKHRRKYHGEEVDDDVENADVKVPPLPCYAPSGTKRSFLSFRPPCVCIDKGKMILGYDGHSDEYDLQEFDDIDVEKEVYDWLKELPVYIDNTEENQAIHREMAQDLITGLKDLRQMPDSDDTAKIYIEDYLERLPIPTAVGEKISRDKKDQESMSEIRAIIADWIDLVNLYLKNSKSDLPFVQMFTKENLLDEFESQLEPIVLRHGTQEELEDKIMAILPIPEEELANESFKTDINEQADRLARELYLIVLRLEEEKEERIRAKFLKPILHWLANNDEVSERSKAKRRELVSEVESKLHKMVIGNAGENDMTVEVNNFLTSLPEKEVSLSSEQKNNLAENIMNEIQYSAEKPIVMSHEKKEELAENLLHKIKPKYKTNKDKREHPVSDWLENDSTISEQAKQKNRHEVRNFDKKLQEMKSQNVSKDVIEDKIQEFLNSLSVKGIPITDKHKRQVARNLIKDLNSMSSPVSAKPVTDWLENAPNISGQAKEMNRNAVRNFDKKLQQLKSQNVNDDVIEEEIQEFVDSLPAKGIPLTPRQKSEVARNLIKDVKSQPRAVDKRPVSDWFENIPSISEQAKEKNRIEVRNFDKKLQEMKSRNVSDDVIENEITEFVDSLSAKGIPLTPTQKGAVARNLINNVNSQPSPVNKQPVTDWLENDPNISGPAKKMNRNAVRNFDKKLQQLKSQNVNDDVIEEEIQEFVDSLPAKGIPLTSKQRREVARNLIKDVKSQPRAVDKRPVSDWFENIPSISEQAKEKNRIEVRNFDKKLQEMKSRNVSDDVIENEITEYVDSLSAKGIPLTPTQKSAVARNLINNVNSQPSPVSKQPVTDWLENDPNISGPAKEMNRNAVRNFDKKLQQLKSQNVNDDVIEEKIQEFVDSLPAKGIPLTPRQKSEVARNLIKDVKSQPSAVNKRPISDWFENIPSISEQAKEKNRIEVRNFDKKLQEMKSRNVSDDVIENEITEFVDSLSAKGIPLTPTQKSAVARNLINNVNSQPSPVSKQPVTDWLENDPNISGPAKEMNRNAVRNFDKKLQQLKSHNVNDDVIEEKIQEFVDSLPAKGIPLTPRQKSEVARNLIKDVKSQPSAVNKRPISDWFENIPSISEQAKEKNRIEVRNFDKKLQEMKSRNVSDDVIENEITEFVDSLSAKGIPLTPTQKSAVARNLINNVNSQPSPVSKQPVTDWLENAPNISGQAIEMNRNAVRNFDKKLQQLKSQNVNDDVIEDEIQEFVDSLPAKGIPLTSKQRSEVARNLIKDVKSQPRAVDKRPVSDWFENIPSISEQAKEKNRIEVRNFEKKLQEMKSRNVSDDVIENEITEFVDSLSAKGIPLTPTQKSAVARNLINNVNSQPSPVNKQPVTDWLENDPNISGPAKEMNRNAVRNFDKKLQQLKSQNVNDDVIEEEIQEFVDSLPAKGIPLTSKQRSEVAKNLVKDVKSQPRAVDKRPVSDWFENIPSISEQAKEKNRIEVRNFDKKLQEMKSRNVSDDVIENEITEFVDSLSAKGIPLTPTQKSAVARNLINNVNSQPSPVSKQPVTDWLENDPNISGPAKEMNRNAVRNFDKKLQQLKSQNVNDDVIEEEIQEFVDSLPAKGIPLTSKQRSEVARNLIKDVKSQPRAVDKRPVSDWFENIPSISEQAKEKNRIEVRNFDKKLQEMKSRNVSDDVIENEITEFVDSLSAKGIPLTPTQKGAVARNLINNFNSQPSPVSKQPVTDWLENAPNISGQAKEMNRNAVRNFDKKLQQLISQNVNDDVIEEEIQEFVDSLPAKGIPLTPRQKSEVARNLIKDVKSQPSAVNKRPISDWFENIPSISEQAKEKNRIEVRNFDKKLQEMKSRNVSDDVIENEITEFVDSLSAKGIPLTPTQKSAVARNLINNVNSQPSPVNKQPVTDWLENDPNISGPAKEMNRNAVRNFDKKLQQLKSQNVNDDVIEEEIQEFVDSLPAKGIPLTPRQKSEVARNLIKDVKSQPRAVDKRPVSDWFENIPSISEQAKEKNRIEVRNFDKKLQEMKSRNVSDDVIENEITEFVDSLSAKGIPLTPTQKGAVARNLINNVNSQLSPVSKQPVTDWLENAPNISGQAKEMNRNAVRNFDKKLQQLKSQNVNDDVIEEEIQEFVDSLPAKGIPLTSKQRREVARNLIKDVKSQPRAVDKRPVSDWFENIPSISEQAKEKNRIEVRNFDKKLQEMKSRNVSDDVIENEITEFVDSLSAKGIPLTPTQKSAVARNLINNVNSQPSPVSKQPVTDWLENDPTISGPAKEMNRNAVRNFDKKLQQLKSQNVNDDVIEEEIQEFVDSLPAKGIPLTSKQRSEVARNLIKDVKSQPRAVDKRPVSDWFENIPSISEQAKEKNQIEVRNFDKKLQGMKSRNVSDDVIENEITEFVDSLSAKGIPLTPTQKSAVARNLINNVNFQPSPVNKQPVTDWLENDPNISGQAKEMNRNAVRNFDKKLQQLKSLNVNDDIIEEEIQEFVDSLPAKGIPLTSKQRSEVARNLIKDVKSQPRTINKTPVSDWLETAPNISEIAKQNNRNVVRNFDKKLQEMQSQNVSEDVIEYEIKEFVESLSAKGIPLNSKQILEVAKNLTKDLKSQPSPGSKQPVTDWLENAPNISGQAKAINRNAVTNFDRKLQQLKSQNVSDDVIEDEIQEFVDSLPAKGIPLTPKQKSELARNLIKDVKFQPSAVNNRLVSEWFENIPSISEQAKEKNRIEVRNFDKKLQEMKSRNVSDDVIENEITEFVDSLSAKGIPLTPKQKSAVARNLINDVNSQPSPVLKHPVTDWLENTPNISRKAKNIYRNAVTNFDRKLQQLKSQNVGDDVIENEIQKFVDSLPGKGIPLTPAQKIELAKNLIKDVKSQPRAVRKQPISDWFESAPNISEQAKENNRKAVSNFDKKLQEMKSQNVSNDVIEDEIQEFVESLSAKGIPLTPKQKSGVARNLISKVNSQPSPTTKQPVTDWLDNAPNISGQAKEMNRNAVRNFDKKLREMKSQNVSNEVIEDEIQEFVESLSAKGIPLTPQQKSAVARDLINNFISQPSPVNKQPVTDWLENAPNISRQAKEMNLNAVRNFDRKLQQLKSQNVSDDIIEDEIQEFVESLPATGIPLTPRQKSALARNLIIDVRSPSSPDRKQPVTDWLENAPNISRQAKGMNRNAVRNFDRKLQQLKSQNVSDDVIEDEIQEFVESLSAKGIPLNPKQKYEITRNLIKNVKSLPIQVSKQPVLDHVINSSNIPERSNRRNRNVVNYFQNAGDDVIEDEIHEFVESLSAKGPLTSNENSEASRNIMKDEKAQASKYPVSDWLDNAPNISQEIKQKNHELVENFDKKLRHMQQQHVDNEVIEDEIRQFLHTLPEKGIFLSPKQKNELSRNFLKQVTAIENHASRQPFTNWLENAPYISEAFKQKNENIMIEFDAKLQDMKSHNVPVDVIENEIRQFVDAFPEMGLRLSAKQKNELTTKLLQDVIYNHPVSDWLVDAKDVSEEIKDKNIFLAEQFDERLKRLRAGKAGDDVIEAEIKDFLDILSRKGITMSPNEKTGLSQLLLKESRLMMPNMSSISVESDQSDQAISSKQRKRWDQSKHAKNPITDQRMRNDELSEKNIMSSIKNADASADETNQTNDELIKKSRDMSVGNKTLDSSQTKPFESSFDKQYLKEAIENTTLDFIQEITGDSSPESRNVKKKGTSLFATKIAEIVSDPNTENKDDNILSEILDYLEMDPINTNIPNFELANQLKEQLETIGFWTSTPYQEGERIFAKKHSDSSDVSYFDTELAEKSYMEELQDIIKSWIDNSSMNLGDFDDEYENNMVEDLSRDIVDREKYIRRNNINQTSEEEIEYLKNQISNWLHKFISDENLPNQRKIRDLIHNIRGIPTLAQRISLQKSIDKSNQVAGPLQIVDKTIAKWLNDSDYLSGLDKNKLRNKTSELATQIKQNMLSSDDLNLSDAILNALSPWIHSVNSDIDDDDLQEMTKEIESALNQQGITESSFKLLRDSECGKRDINKGSREIIEENLIAALLKWLKQQPLYQDRSASEKRIQENIVKDMAHGIINVIEQHPPHSDVDPSLLEEIKTHLQKFPMNPKFQINKRFMGELPGQILDYLKGFQLLQYISDCRGQAIENHANKWAKDLPLLRINSAEKAGFDILKGNLIDQLKNIQPGDETKLRYAIRNFVDNVPLDLKHVKENESFFKSLEDQLIAALKGKQQELQKKKQENLARLLEAPDKFVKAAVHKWVKSLALPKDDIKVLNEAKDDLVRTLADALVAHKGQIPQAKENELFRHATAQFLEKISRHPYTPEDTDILADYLKELFKDSLNKSLSHSERPVKPVVKKGADALLDDIANWVTSLPIESDTPDEMASAENIKKRIENQLIYKIGELNMNPVIFNDDFIYQDIIEDEIDKLLSNIPSENVKKQLPKLKQELLDIVMKARQKIQEENAGQIYKQKLREAIERTLPCFDLTSPEGQASFAVLKDNVADLFINMHYVGNDPEEIYKLRQKINDEIYTFCLAYLKRCPASPLDTRKLNEVLYNALKKIAEPRNESFRDEVDFIKIKNEINNWMKELPLRNQSSLRKFQANKIISVLAKKIHDIENERDSVADDEYEQIMKKEIIKFLNKLPLATKKDEFRNEYAEQLIQYLRDTEVSRILNASARHSIDSIPCPSACYRPPPCTLSKEDLDHLERIRKRCGVKRKISFKDVSLSPCSVDIASQTDLRDTRSNVCSESQYRGHKNSSAQTCRTGMQAVGIQIGVSPYAVINEHQWNSVDENCSQLRTCGVSMPRRMACAPLPQLPQISRRGCIPAPRRQHSSHSAEPCSPQTRSCISQQQIRAPFLREGQLLCRPTARNQTGHFSAPSPRQSLSLDTSSEMNVTQPQSSGPDDQSYENNLSTQPDPSVPEESTQRPQSSHQSQRSEMSTQRIIRDSRSSQYRSGNSCLGPVEQMLSEHRTPCYGRQMVPNPCMYQPWHNQGQPHVSTQSSGPFYSFQPREISNPRYCYIRSSTPPISSEDHEAGPSCSIQKRATHSESFDQAPHVCVPPFHVWGRMPDYNYWKRDKNTFTGMSDDYKSHGKRYRCKKRCGNYNERRRPCHLHDDETMNSCPKCCGVHCPYPSYMFFR